MTRIRRARTAARQLFRDCLVRTLLDEDRAHRVVVQLIEAKRRDAAAILSQFHRLVRLDHERRCLFVESATPLPLDLRTRIESVLARACGAGLHSSFVQNPSLIGGIRVRVGSDVYDGTVRGRLAALEARM